jgi:hypothetical protein
MPVPPLVFWLFRCQLDAGKLDDYLQSFITKVVLDTKREVFMIVALMSVVIETTPHGAAFLDDRFASKPDFPLLVGEREPRLRVDDLSNIVMVKLAYSSCKSVIFYGDFRLIIGVFRQVYLTRGVISVIGLANVFQHLFPSRGISRWVGFSVRFNFIKSSMPFG